jgi:RIO kinase 1
MADSSGDDDYELNYSKTKYKRNNLRNEEDENLADQGDKLLNLMAMHNAKSSKINLDFIEYSNNLSHDVMKNIKDSEAKEKNSFVARKDKKDRATVEQVLDARTRVILVKLMNKGTITEINGCISTGKEANVYHALTPDGKSLAIKIYKTSILIFKDREKYIQGEFRFRRGYCKSNPRKLIKLWAEKEMRNLKRIYQSDIPCPNPMLVKSNILVMEFLGEEMRPAPRLKNAELTTEKLSALYLDLVIMMRTLYQECHLIHADLSEYNMLYHQEKLYMIDVSQSIEHDHPQALDFLRRDIYNVNLYFKKYKVQTFRVKEIFDFITDCNITKETEKQELTKMIESWKEKVNTGQAGREEDDEIFKDIHIPRTLNEIDMKQAEKDIKGTKTPNYSKLTGIKRFEGTEGEEGSDQMWQNYDDNGKPVPKEAAKVIKEEVKEEASSDGSSDSEESDDSESNTDSSGEEEEGDDSNEDDDDKDKQDGEKESKKPRLVLDDKEANKERKKKIKEDKREKRKTKIPKYDKKKANKRKDPKEQPKKKN